MERTSEQQFSSSRHAKIKKRSFPDTDEGKNQKML